MLNVITHRDGPGCQCRACVPRVDVRALLREAADALARKHLTNAHGEQPDRCTDCDLIRRLREASK